MLISSQMSFKHFPSKNGVSITSSMLCTVIVSPSNVKLNSFSEKGATSPFFPLYSNPNNVQNSFILLLISSFLI